MEELLLRRLVVLCVDKDDVVRNDAGGHALGAVLVRDLSVVDASLHDRPLALAQVLQHRVAECGLEHHHPVPVRSLGPVPGLESGRGLICQRGVCDH